MSDINITVQDEIVNIDILDEPVLVNVVNSPGVPGAPGQGVPVGGTTGQVLAKNSNTNYDTEWVDVSGGVWGDITGTLSDQTDLQTALDGKFDEPTGDTTQYIAGDGSLVAFPITGQAGTLVREVRNVTGATLLKGTVVYINGASGNKPTVAKAIATSDATSAQTFGLIQADIPNNSNGYLVAFGDLDGLDTSAFADGVQLYLSSTVLGGYTSTKQYAPAHLVYIGVVTRSHPNQGRIEVRIQNGFEMDELHDVAAQTPSSNDGLFYNTTTSLWENKSIATALGYTPANSATTLTINGVTYDLSANRSWTVAAGITGSGASGQVAYWNGTSSQSGSANFLWDNTNSNLAIGAATTWQAGIGKLSVVNGATDAPILSLKNTDATKQVYYASYNDSNKSLQYIVYGSTAPGTLLGQFRANAAVILGYNTPSVLAIGNFESVPLVLGTNNAERLRIFGSTGNVGINTGSSDTGERLQVTGDVKVTGNFNITASTSTITSNNLAFTTGSGSQQYSFFLGSSRKFAFTGGSQNATSGTSNVIDFQFGVAPTSGTGVFNLINIGNTINQAGGANGITRGLYVNPTLTAAADFRAIETTNGKVIFGNLPTSSAGLPTGAIWNNGGVINIV